MQFIESQRASYHTQSQLFSLQCTKLGRVQFGRERATSFMTQYAGDLRSRRSYYIPPFRNIGPLARHNYESRIETVWVGINLIKYPAFCSKRPNFSHRQKTINLKALIRCLICQDWTVVNGLCFTMYHLIVRPITLQSKHLHWWMGWVGIHKDSRGSAKRISRIKLSIPAAWQRLYRYL